MNENTFTTWADRERLSVILLANLKANRAAIEDLAARFDDDEADAFYRFYHQSFKTFSRQQYIRNAIKVFEAVAPEQRTLNKWLRTIVDHALAQTFETGRTNDNWLPECRPIVEGFAHTHAFLRALRWSAENLNESPQMLPDQWALTLYLFDCR